MHVAIAIASQGMPCGCGKGVGRQRSSAVPYGTLRNVQRFRLCLTTEYSRGGLVKLDIRRRWEPAPL